ncbi:MAG: lipoprotein-releasing ABC transporter permease subunit [Arenicella sp.]
MKLSLPAYIGLRYSRAKRRNGFISFIGWVSIVGIAIGVLALIVTISVMNGFGQELRGRMLDVASHVTVEGRAGNWLDNWQDEVQQVQRVVGTDDVAPYINGQGLATLGSSVNAALIRGIDPELELKVSKIQQYLMPGTSFSDLVAGKYRVIIGQDLARLLNVELGEKITLMAPQGQATPGGLIPRLRRFEVVGIFDLGMYEVDSTLALVHIDDAAKLYKTKGGISGLRVKLNDVYQAPDIRDELYVQYGRKYFVTDWTQQHKNFFRALVVEKRVMFILLFLIVAVAAINIVSTLVMVVTDKQADIAILRTMGLSPGGIMRIFFVQGATSGLVGTFIGAVLGVLIALNLGSIIGFLEGVFGFQFFPPDVYVITNFPAELRMADLLSIVLGSLFISMVATLFPAWRASKIQPAEALRYE